MEVLEGSRVVFRGGLGAGGTNSWSDTLITCGQCFSRLPGKDRPFANSG